MADQGSLDRWTDSRDMKQEARGKLQRSGERRKRWQIKVPGKVGQVAQT